MNNMTEEEAILKTRELQKQARHLEIELDYIESKEPHNYKYITNLEKRIDEVYKEIDRVDEINKVSKS